MNYQIESWRVAQYTNNVYHLSQQMGSRLAGLVRRESFKGKSEFFDRLGLATAQKKTGRNSDTPNLDIAHSRRRLTTNMFEWATLVDRKDKLQNIHAPESEYAKAAANAMGRAMDSEIISALIGTAYVGEDGTSTQELGTGQIIACTDGAAATQLKLNVRTLRLAKQLMDEQEVDPSITRYMLVNAGQLSSLLAATEVSNADYNTVKALVQGELDTFLGFKFIRSELLPLASAMITANSFDWGVDGKYAAGGAGTPAATDELAIAFTSDSVILGVGQDMAGRIDERSDKSYSMQVYNSMDIGAVRMEEAKVIGIVCATA